MDELIKVNYESEQPTVSARDLHEKLGVAHRFNDWMNTNKKLFVEGEDYTTVPVLVEVDNNGGIQSRQLNDYLLTIEAAKHLCMMSRTEKGKQCRQYFIDLEKAWNTPEQVMARALQVATKTIDSFKLQVAEMKPKAEYFDELVDRNLLTNFRDTAKELGVGERFFVSFLLDRGYVYRDQKKKLKPCAEKNNGLFEIKEFSSRYSDHAGIQTLITPRGREVFRLLIKGGILE